MTHHNYTFTFRLFTLFLTMACASSCEKFLDERPSKNSSLPVETVAQLNALLENYNIYYADQNPGFLHTDDYGLTKELFDARPASNNFVANLLHAFWDTENIPTATSGDLFWGSTSGEWRDVFYANAVLANVDKVEGNPDEKARIKADAYLIRAYAYWQLAETYCLPYTDARKSEPGLPIKRSPSFQENLKRSSLEETYRFIEADLKEALKINKPLVVAGRPQHWRSSTAAANGFAARYYLSRHNYAEAQKYADLALGEYSILHDYNVSADMRYGNNQTVSINSGTPSASTFTIRYPYTHNNQVDLVDMVGWKEFLYFRMLNYGSWWYIPSQSLLDLYDKTNDLRYEYHIVEGYSYDRGMNTSPAYNYPGYIHFFKDRLPAGPTTAEMYLIRAECLARTGNTAGAMTAVNLLRAKRMKPGAWVNLTASSPADAVAKVLQERRREMPFGMRWFDIRRYNSNSDPSDDVVITKTFYPVNLTGAVTNQAPITITIPKDSRKYALPLPFADILSSDGQLEQNKY